MCAKILGSFISNIFVFRWRRRGRQLCLKGKQTRKYSAPITPPSNVCIGIWGVDRQFILGAYKHRTCYLYRFYVMVLEDSRFFHVRPLADRFPLTLQLIHRQPVAQSNHRNARDIVLAPLAYTHRDVLNQYKKP